MRKLAELRTEQEKAEAGQKKRPRASSPERKGDDKKAKKEVWYKDCNDLLKYQLEDIGTPLNILETEIEKYMTKYGKDHGVKLTFHKDEVPNYNKSTKGEIVEALNSTCQHIKIVNENDIKLVKDHIIYTGPVNMFFLVGEQGENRSVVGVVKYSIKEISSVDNNLLKETDGVEMMNLIECLLDRMIYISVRCVNETHRKRGIGHLLVAKVLLEEVQDAANKKEPFPTVVHSTDASNLPDIKIGQVRHAAHMKSYAGCHLTPDSYYQDTLTSIDMVTKCLKRECLNDDWLRYCQKSQKPEKAIKYLGNYM
jgi:hypothetical protein